MPVGTGVVWIAVVIYLVALSVLAVVQTVHDKSAARRQVRRVPERTLLLVAALGGSVAMLVTMRAIRHKTRHPKFMIGIPVIIVVQVVVVVLVAVACLR